MFCPKCGKELKPGTKFCNGCGASLEGPPKMAPDSRSQKPKKGRGAAIALLLILAVLLLLGGGAVAAYKLNLFDSFWNPSSEEVRVDKDKKDKEKEEEEEEEETDEEEADDDETDDGKTKEETGKKDRDAADDKEEDGKAALDEEGAKETKNEKHTKINDLPEQSEAAATTAAYNDPAPAQTAASGFPAETTGAAQAYSDFTAPGVGNGAILETTPGAAAAGSDASYMIMDSSSRRLTASDLYGLSKEQLKIARNEIYARHGRLFDSESLQFYFNSKSWYHGTIAPSAFSEDLLSQVEKDNVKLIKEREASMP